MSVDIQWVTERTEMIDEPLMEEHDATERVRVNRIVETASASALRGRRDDREVSETRQ